MIFPWQPTSDNDICLAATSGAGNPTGETQIIGTYKGSRLSGSRTSPFLTGWHLARSCSRVPSTRGLVRHRHAMPTPPSVSFRSPPDLRVFHLSSVSTPRRRQAAALGYRRRAAHACRTPSYAMTKIVPVTHCSLTHSAQIVGRCLSAVFVFVTLVFEFADTT